MAPIIENVATAALTVFALTLSAIAFRAYRHTGSRKVLWLAVGFTLFLVKGVGLSIGLFTVPDWQRLLVASVLIDLIVLTTFYLAVLR